jgi:hypothetical protein
MSDDDNDMKKTSNLDNNNQDNATIINIDAVQIGLYHLEI